MDNNSKEKKVVDHLREGRKFKKYLKKGQVKKGQKRREKKLIIDMEGLLLS